MKKIIFLLGTVMVATGAFAQKIEWGVKAGLNVSSLSNSDIEGGFELDDFEFDLDISSKMKPSFHVGVFVTVPINNFISFQPEVMYSRQGNFYKVTEDGETVKAWTRLNYINIPLMFKFKIAENFSIDLGPQFGIATDLSIKAKSGGASVTIDAESDDYETFDVSGALGATYTVCSKIDIYARYNLGFTKVVKDTDDKIKNGVIQLGVGYRF